MVSGTPAAPSRRWEIGSSDPSSVPLSGPGRSVTSAAVTLHTLATALCEKKAPLCRGERPCVVTVCLGVQGEGAGGSKILTAQLWHRSKQSRGAEWQKQDVIVSHSEKHCGRQRDNRSFNSTSSVIFLPAEIGFMKNVAKKQLGRNGVLPAWYWTKARSGLFVGRNDSEICFSCWLFTQFCTTGVKMQL